MKILCVLFVIQFVYVYSETFPIDGCSHGCQAEESCIAFGFNRKCYYIFNKNITTWDGNRKLCEDNALSMVKVLKEMVHSRFSEELMRRELRSYANVWLGGKVDDFSEWIYVNGVPINKTTSPPIKDQVSQDMHLCITVHNGSKLYQDDCRYMHNFVCRFDDWQNIPSLYVSEITASWYEGRSRCLDLGGDLFYLKEGETLNFINLYTKMSPYPDRYMFIGLTKRMWYWEGGDQIKYYNWQDKEPNIFSEKCLSMLRKEGTWSDANCQTEMPAFCQGEYTYSPEMTSMATPLSAETSDVGGLVALGAVFVICLLVIAALALALLQQKGINCMSGTSQKHNSHPIGNDTRRNEVRDSDQPLLAIGQNQDNSKQQQLSQSSHVINEPCGEFPSPVSLVDKGATCIIELTMKEMEDTSPKSRRPKNVKFMKSTPIIQERLVHIKCLVLKPDKTSVTYEYKKDLPEEIVRLGSNIEYSPGKMRLILKKAEASISWKGFEENLTTDAKI